MHSTIRLGLALAACSACSFLACASPAPTRSPATTTRADQAVSAPLAPAGANDASAPVGPPAPPVSCRLTVTDTQGCGTGDVEALVAPVRPQIEHCRGASGGKLRIRVRKAPGGKLAFGVEPGSSLDASEQKCVLDALTTLSTDESSTAWSGLSVRPTGFTSLLTIEW